MATPQSEKLRHLAVCLPLIGLFLLMPPALLVFGIETTLAGIPLTVLYIFGVWGGLIGSAALLARYLDARKSTGHPPIDQTTLSDADLGHADSDADHRQ